MKGLLRFHLAVGARLAMRALAPAIVGAVAGGMLLGDDFLVSLAGVLFGPRSSGGSAALIALACLGAAATAAPKVCRGLDGWLRHLPASGVAHRRAATLAVAVAQIPLWVMFAVLSLYGSAGRNAFAADCLGLALTGLAAAALVIPVRHPLLARPLALAAGIAAGSGGWWLLAAAAALLGVTDAASGPIGRSRVSVAPRRGSAGSWIEARIAWRALGSRLGAAFLLGLLPLGAAFAFSVNNDLAPAHERLATLLGGGCAVVFLLAQLGESLAVRRPAWPWLRSLPGSAAQRAGFDALFLGLHTVPLLILAVWMTPAPEMLIAVAALVPLLATRTAGAVRRAPERRTGAAGEIFAEGLPLAALTALLPWVAVLALAATPFALRAAAERERAQKVSRWLALHHLAAGDPQSWSAS